MKDTKIPQLIINDLTKKQYDSITPAQDELYITDEEYRDIPIGFGQFASNKPADNWAEVTDDFVNAADYSKIWTMILGVLDGEISVNGVYVCTVETAEKMVSGVRSWEKVTGEQKILKYYIVDRENQKFKFPREIPEYRAIGVSEDIVIAGPSNYSGVYSVSNNGKYFENGAFFKVKRATKTVDGKTYNYYKPVQWNNPSVEIPVLAHGDESHKCITTEELSALTTLELINDKYQLLFLYCQEMGENREEYEHAYEIVGSYPEYHLEKNKAVNEFSAKICLFDEEYGESNRKYLEDIIPEGCEEAVITYSIYGYVNPPKVSEYTCGTRLYIKVE